MVVLVVFGRLVSVSYLSLHADLIVCVLLWKYSKLLSKFLKQGKQDGLSTAFIFLPVEKKIVYDWLEDELLVWVWCRQHVFAILVSKWNITSVCTQRHVATWKGYTNLIAALNQQTCIVLITKFLRTNNSSAVIFTIILVQIQYKSTVCNTRVQFLL